MEEEIVLRASDPNPSSRTFDWPVLEAGNDSYENGSYSVTFKDEQTGKSFRIQHKIQGAALVEQWIDTGKVSFICSVASPRSMYRKLHKSTSPAQLIEWQREDLGEYPTFTPMIVANQEIQHVVDSVTDDLNPIWNGKYIQLPKGGRIAVGPTFKFESGMNMLLDFCQDDNLQNGQLRVEASSEHGFKFKAHLAHNLYQHLRYRRNDLAGRNIMVHVVSAALGILQREYRDEEDENGEGWGSFPNLAGLSDILEEKGLKHWTDEGFRPEEVASRLYPHTVPEEGELS